SPQAILSAHLTQAPPPVTERREVPATLAELVMKCLKKKPADRWQRAEELVPLLEGIATPGTGTTGGSAPPRVWHARPGRWVEMAIGITLIALAGVGGWYAFRIRRTDEPPRIA